MNDSIRYFESPPALQFLHSLKNRVKGGESIFLDTHAALDILVNTYPNHYQTLVNSMIPYQFETKLHNYTYSHPVICPSNGLYYSPPFQGVLKASKEMYDAMRVFDEILEDDKLVFTRRLEEGECVVFENRRVLHGRHRFDASSGERHLRGTYVGRDAYDSVKRSVLKG